MSRATPGSAGRPYLGSARKFEVEDPSYKNGNLHRMLQLTPTEETYGQLNRAYAFFNLKLFGGVCNNIAAQIAGVRTMCRLFSVWNGRA